MANNNYFIQRDHTNKIKLQAIIFNDLPDFCRPYFISINNSTSTLTQLNYAYDLRVFFTYLSTDCPSFQNIAIKDFDTLMLDKITTLDIDNYLSYLEYYYNSDDKLKSNTATGKSRKLSSIKSLFQYLLKNNLVKKNPAAFTIRPKLHSKEIVRLDSAEINKLLQIVDDGNGLTSQQKICYNKTKIRDIALLNLLLGTGIRVSECVGLNLDDIDFDNSSIRVTRKGGNTVILYFPDEIGGALRDYYLQRKAYNEEKKLDDVALFFSLQDKRITTRAVENIIKKYSKIATPLKTISPHKLRTTFGTQLYRATGDIYIVADVLGHKDVNTTKKHYAAISDDLRKKAAEKVKLRRK